MISGKKRQNFRDSIFCNRTLLSTLPLFLVSCATTPPAESQNPEKKIQSLTASLAEKDQKLLEFETTNQTLLAKIENLESKLRAAESRAEIRQKADAHPKTRNSLGAALDLKTIPVGPEISDEVARDYSQARALLDSEKYPEAILSFSTLVEHHSTHPLSCLAQFHLAEAYLRQGEYGLAEQEYYQTISKYPHSPLISSAYQRLGLALRKQGKTREAEAAESQVEALFPQAPAASEVARQKSVQPDPGAAAAAAASEPPSHSPPQPAAQPAAQKAAPDHS